MKKERKSISDFNSLPAYLRYLHDNNYQLMIPIPENSEHKTYFHQIVASSSNSNKLIDTIDALYDYFKYIYPNSRLEESEFIMTQSYYTNIFNLYRRDLIGHYYDSPHDIAEKITSLVLSDYVFSFNEPFGIMCDNFNDRFGYLKAFLRQFIERRLQRYFVDGVDQVDLV
jgi:hypothetical protein